MPTKIDFALPPDLVVEHDQTSVMSAERPWPLPAGVYDPIWAKVTGSGVNVAVIDTGYEDHKILPKAKIYTNLTNESDRLYNSHGVHCAGTALGRDGYGVAPGADLFAYKVLEGKSGSGSSDNIAKAIRTAADDGAHVISMSLGGPSPYKPTEQALQYATDKGCVVVAAAGNSGFNGSRNSIGYPAKYGTNVIACGATKAPYEDQRIAGFSSGGRQIDFAVGGEKILSAYSDNRIGHMSGTSMSCPNLAGHYALAIEALRMAGKPLPTTYTAWKTLFIDIARDAGVDGFDQYYGHGVIYGPDVAKILSDSIDSWGL